MKKLKERLDVLLVEKGYFSSREKAKASIMAGIVFVDGERFDKAGTMVDTEANILVKDNICPYVSRGGLKLEKSMKLWNDIDLKDAVCMDIGASTGGFTDCMLQNGASKVYSIDVGYGQLAWKLRSDERVINLERTNIRYVNREQVPDEIDFFSVDVSFISLCLVLPAAYPLLSENGECVCLIKPQFEAGREKVGKKGVVRDKSVHAEVIRKIYDFSIDLGFTVCGLDYSPIKGPEGNIEYLIYLKKGSDENYVADIDEVVEASHSDLDK